MPIGLEEYMIPECINPSPVSLFNFKRIEDMSKDKYVILLKDLYSKGDLSPFSITGGYCRNHMLGVQTETDIDIVTSNIEDNCMEFSKYFKEIKGNVIVRTYQLPDNTMHLLSQDFSMCIDGFYHIFIHPLAFDFTINLGCISMVDGNLYAPPITTFDIKNKILRPCSIGTESHEMTSVLSLPIILRAIRFALKFDMRMHISLLHAMNILFTLQNEVDSTDDVSIYHVLKHINEDSPSFKEKYYSALRSLKFISTDKYSTFDDYFKYIESNINTNPRTIPIGFQTRNRMIY